MRPMVLCLVLMVMISCESEVKERTHQPVQEKSELIRSEKNISERFLRIEDKVDTLRQETLAKALFGKFHNHRLECYIIDSPNKTIYNKPVKAITLYYLDGVLARTRYQLEEDISDDLIQSYGSFTIRAFDAITRDLCHTEKVVQMIDRKKVLNKNLKNYRLKWSVNSKMIYTRVDKTAPKKRFDYIESLEDYEERYQEVERDL